MTTHRFRTLAPTALQSIPLPIIRMRPLIALNMFEHHVTMAAHAYKLFAGWTLARVARLNAGVRASLGPRFGAGQFAYFAVISSLVMEERIRSKLKSERLLSFIVTHISFMGKCFTINEDLNWKK